MIVIIVTVTGALSESGLKFKFVAGTEAAADGPPSRPEPGRHTDWHCDRLRARECLHHPSHDSAGSMTQ